MPGARVIAGTLLALALAAAATASASAASSRTAPRIAVVRGSDAPPVRAAAQAIRETLRRERPMPEILPYYLPNDAQGPAILAQAHQARPDVIVTLGSRATAAALADSRNVPVVFSMVLHPAASGFLVPGVTGASLDVPLDAQLRLLRRLLPKAKTIGVLYDPEETGAIVEQAGREAQRAGLRLESERVAGPAEAMRAVERLARRVDVIWAIPDGNVFTPLTSGPIQLVALQHRVPLIGFSASQARTGALAAFTLDYEDVGRHTAEIVRRVLAGEAPGRIPVAGPRKTGTVLNARTARRLRLALDPALLSQASEVVR